MNKLTHAQRRPILLAFYKTCRHFKLTDEARKTAYDGLYSRYWRNAANCYLAISRSLQPHQHEKGEPEISE